MLKKCKYCELDKESSEFNLAYQGAKGPVFRSECRGCQRAYLAGYFAANKDKFITYGRAKNLNSKYKLSVADYDVMLESQGGTCLFCHKTKEDYGAFLAVDHCHATGRVRGLVCRSCNGRIGYFETNVGFLDKALEYLAKHA